MKKLYFIPQTLITFIFCSPISWVLGASLHHAWIKTSNSKAQEIIYVQNHGVNTIEGDILLPKSDPAIKGAIIMPRLGGEPWPNSTIPYKFAPNFPALSQLYALDAMDLWHQKTHVRFIELHEDEKENHPNYVLFTPAGGTLCASHVGMQGGEQEIKLASRCNTMSIVHEIGHTLGLWHEQSRRDRDRYVAIIWDNISEINQYNFSQYLSNGKDFGDYDYQSIMHYSAYAFSINGEKTIIPIKPNVEIGQRIQLSEKDIAAVQGLYPNASQMNDSSSPGSGN